MANRVVKTNGGTSATALTGMLTMAIAGGLICGLSFYVITIWPQPIAVAPYFEDNLFGTGFVWGFFFGGLVGWIVGWLTDETRFIDASYE